MFAAALVACAGRGACAEPARAAAAGDSLDGRPVRRIVLEANSIFSPLPERGRWFYRLANRLHIVTREQTLRAAVVMREGDAFRESERAETERHLRALAFVVPDTVMAVPVGRDSVDVRIVTHDNWTTSPEFALENGGGHSYGTIALSERNFLGRGTSLSLAYRSDVAGISRLVRIDDGEVFGSHWLGHVTYGSSNGGNLRAATLALPFWSEDAPTSMTFGGMRATSDASLFDHGVQVASAPVRVENFDAACGAGRRTADGAIRRVTAMFELRDRAYGASRAEPDAGEAFRFPGESWRLRRLAVEVCWLRPRYLVVRGVEQMDRKEDVNVGRTLALKLGVARRAFGSTYDEGFARAEFGAGCDAGRAGHGLVHADVQSRLLADSLAEAQADFGARWVQQPHPALALVAGVMGVSTYHPSPLQAFGLGGLTGLRAFPVHALTGTQVWRANAEARWVAARDVFKLVSVGGAAFWDSGCAWGRGSEPGRWVHDAGLGLRLSMPHSAMNAIARFDVAWAVAPGRHGPSFSFGSGQSF